MLGELDPFELSTRLPRKAFIWWQVRKELKLSELHEKWEYYAAAIRGDICGIMSGEVPEIDSMLLKMDLCSIKEEIDMQQRQDEMFMVVMGALESKLNR